MPQFADLARARIEHLRADQPAKSAGRALGLAGATLAALAAVATIYTVLGPRDQDADGPDYAPVIVDDEAPTATRASEDENGSQLAILPNVAADDAAWARAQAQATLAAYRDYLSNTAHTRHRSDAQTAVNRHEAAVMRLQTALTAKGFNAGVADGIAGSGTRRRYRRFSVP